MVRLFLLFLLLMVARLHAARTLAVGPAGTGAAHASLGAALEAAGDGDTLLVGPGIYREKELAVRKAVHLRGQGWPVLESVDGKSILDVRAHGVTLRGLVFRGVGQSYVQDQSAILLTEARGTVIEENRFEKDFFAVYGLKSRGTIVRGNILEGIHAKEHSNGNGIHFWRSDSIEITRNQVRGHRDGIYLEFTGNSRAEGNVCESNSRYGLHFMYSDRNAYRDNAFRRNGAGVAVMYSTGVDMRDNVFEGNWGPGSYGLLLKTIRHSRIEHNLFADNTVAVFMEQGSDLDFRKNTFRRNGWALRIVADCENNSLEENRFDGNTFDVAYNASTANSNRFRRNVWDRYAGWDLDRDRVGDVPHRPVELFPSIMQKHPQAMILLRSHFASLLNVLERMFPTLTPASLEDTEPVMPAVAGRREAT